MINFSVLRLWMNEGGFLREVGEDWLLCRGPLSLETPLAQTDFQKIEAEPSQKKMAVGVRAHRTVFFCDCGRKLVAGAVTGQPGRIGVVRRWSIGVLE